MGPSAAGELVAQLEPGLPRLGHPAREALLRAVASAVVRTQAFHPNHHELYLKLTQALGSPQVDELDDPGRFLGSLHGLAPAEQQLVLHVLMAAAVLDGRVSSRERKLVAEAHRACGPGVTLPSLHQARDAFVSGKGLPPLPSAEQEPSLQAS